MNTPPLQRRATHLARRAAGLAAIGLIVGAQTQAAPQHRCRIDGRLVVQAEPCAEPQAAPAALRPTLIAADHDEDAAAPPKKRTLADIMREREEENRARPKSREPQIDGSRILRDRMGAL